MITGRWGKPTEVLLDISVDAQGNVTGLANPGRQDARIEGGRFDAATGAVHLEGAYVPEGQPTIPFVIDGRLDGRTLRLEYQFGEMRGNTDIVRVEDYRPPQPTIVDRIKPLIADFQRWFNSLSRPKAEENARKLRERGESLDSIVMRDATLLDVPALAELHVTTWNATYNTTNGPTVATRAWQWTSILANPFHKDIIIVLEDRSGRLIGFSRALPTEGEFAGNLSKIYLRWEYHGLGLGRMMMGEVARRLLALGVTNMTLFAEASNPTIGFYDRMNGERLFNERGGFDGGYVWRDLRKLAELCPARPPARNREP